MTEQPDDDVLVVRDDPDLPEYSAERAEQMAVLDHLEKQQEEAPDGDR